MAAALAGLRPLTWLWATDPEEEPAATSPLEKALWPCVRGTAGSSATGCHAPGVLGGALLRVGLRFQLSLPSCPPPPPACPLELCSGTPQEMGLISATALKGPDVEKCQSKPEALPSPRPALWPGGREPPSLKETRPASRAARVSLLPPPPRRSPGRCRPVWLPSDPEKPGHLRPPGPRERRCVRGGGQPRSSTAGRGAFLCLRHLLCGSGHLGEGRAPCPGSGRRHVDLEGRGMPLGSPAEVATWEAWPRPGLGTRGTPQDAAFSPS